MTATTAGGTVEYMLFEAIFYSVDDAFLMLNYQLFPGNWIQSRTHYTEMNHWHLHRRPFSLTKIHFLIMYMCLR